MNFLSRMLNLSYFSFNASEKKLSSFGKWAIITGASDGIGKAIAKEMVNEDLNLILIGRNEEKLQMTVKEVGF